MKLLIASAALLVVAGLFTMGASTGTREVNFSEIQAPLFQQKVQWDIWPSTCHRNKCDEKFGTFGNDQNIYFKAELRNFGNYRFDKATARKLKKGPSYISITVSGNVYKAPLIKLIGRRILVFKYDVSDEDALCSELGTGFQGRKDLDGIGVSFPRGSGCPPDNRSQMLGGEPYGQLYDNTAGRFGRYKVDKSKIGIEVDGSLDSGLCVRHRKPRPNDIPASVYEQCSALLDMARELNGLNWSPRLPLADWDGVLREEDGTGPILELDLSRFTVTGRIKWWALHQVVGNDMVDDNGLRLVRIPQLNIEHRDEWEGHSHTMAYDDAGYVLCYYIKCDADFQPYMPRKWNFNWGSHNPPCHNHRGAFSCPLSV